MKIASFPRNRSPKQLFFSFFLIAPLAFSLIFALPTASFAQQTQLSLADILTGLRSKKVTLDERNKLLTEAVKKRGITFALTPEIEKELETTGAGKDFVEAIREKSPAAKPNATPQPKPAPLPASTPAAPDFNFYQNRANAHFVKGEYDLAVADYSKVVELKPADASTYLYRGLALYNKKNYAQAIADYDKSIELGSKDSMAYYNRGNTYEKIGNLQRAIQDYQKAVELDADNQPAKDSLQRLQAQQVKEVPMTPKKETVSTPAPAATAFVAAAAPPPTAAPANLSQPVEAGDLRKLAVRLTMPVYSSINRNMNVQGLVTVQVTLDEDGKVTSAKATAGPKALRAACEDAIRTSKFKPALAANQPTKSTGFINFNFINEQK